jgi:hypothetical protein
MRAKPSISGRFVAHPIGAKKKRVQLLRAGFDPSDVWIAINARFRAILAVQLPKVALGYLLLLTLDEFFFPISFIGG